MTKVTIFKNREDNYLAVSCFGHALYADHGSDVVCAGISVLVINTFNSIGAFTAEQIEIEEDRKNCILSLKFQKPSGHDGRLLLDSMILGLQEIQKTYGDEYLTLDFKEV